MLSVVIECRDQEPELAVTLSSLVQGAVEGIVAEAFILANNDIAGLEDEELEDLVRNSEQWDHDSKIIVKRPEGKAFTFINFNYEVV